MQREYPIEARLHKRREEHDRTRRTPMWRNMPIQLLSRTLFDIPLCFLYITVTLHLF